MQLHQQLTRVKLNEASAALAILQFTDAQQAAKTCHQGIGFADGLVQCLGLRRVQPGLLTDAVQLCTQAGEWCAQVVGNVVAHALDLMHQPFYPVKHGVDDGGQHVQLVAPGRQR
ncbi:hypothetical protein D3C73_1344260 [compost metagenome]